MDPEPNPSFSPTDEEYEAMLVIVRKANPPGMERHFHIRRLLYEYQENKKYEENQRALLQKQSD